MNSVGNTVYGEANDHSVELLDAVLRVSQQVRIRLNDWLGQFELTDGRLGVLTALSHAGDRGMSQADLADALKQSASNVSTLIERMSRDGLVTRVPSTTDKRKRLLSISSQGEAQLASVETQRSAWSRKTFQMITTAEQTELLGLLLKIGAEDGIASARHHVTVVDTDRKKDLVCDPAADPESPHFALQQMLLALSSSVDSAAHDERAAA